MLLHKNKAVRRKPRYTCAAFCSIKSTAKAAQAKRNLHHAAFLVRRNSSVIQSDPCNTRLCNTRTPVIRGFLAKIQYPQLFTPIFEKKKYI